MGRYGDHLNPWGDLITMARVWCLAMPISGRLLFGVPFEAPLSQGGPGDSFVYNLHRIYSGHRYPHLVANWELLDWHGGGEDPQRPRAFKRLNGISVDAPGILSGDRERTVRAVLTALAQEAATTSRLSALADSLALKYSECLDGAGNDDKEKYAHEVIALAEATAKAADNLQKLSTSLLSFERSEVSR